MTASQFAQLLHARRIGKGKYLAKCPSHSDHKPSLSIAEGKRGVLVKCMSAGCDTRDILKALGLTYSDLFYDKASPQVRARTSLRDQREDMERELGLICWLSALEPGKWNALEKQVRADLQLVRCRIEPLRMIQEWRGRRWEVMNRTQRERYLEAVWERFKCTHALA